MCVHVPVHMRVGACAHAHVRVCMCECSVPHVPVPGDAPLATHVQDGALTSSRMRISDCWLPHKMTWLAHVIGHLQSLKLVRLPPQHKTLFNSRLEGA